MRLKHIYISKYKNLTEFTLDFEGDSFIDVFVGKNGTGKSNLFEALIEIFKHLFEDDYEVNFDFKLIYEFEGNEISISWKWAESIWIDETEKEVKKIGKEQLPDNILIYYSGHNNKITELVENYESTFKKGLKEANEGDTREFIGIGKEYKALLLSVLLLQPDECKAKQFIAKKLGIKSIDNQVKITLKRPFYAKKKGYDIDSLEPKTRFWKAQGITLEFLDKLSAVKKGDIEKGKVRDEDYIYNDDYEDEFIIYLDIADFQNNFSGTSPQDIFRDFDNLKTIEMLDDISIELELLDGSIIGVDKFSDGQFQSVYIYSIMELFKDRNCITLLDEPDSFLHPEWQFDFLNQILEITDQQSVSNHVLMTTHSPSTLTSYKETHLNIFEINDENKVVCHKMIKADIIHSLSSGLISLTENEAKLNINHFLNNTSGAVLFTEGITDEMIVETAWEKLYPGTKPNFEIQNAFSCGFLRNLIKDETLYNNAPDRKFFSLFDFDEAFGDWNQLGTDVETNPTNCLTKKYKTFESYSMLLPVPAIEDISKQVLNPHIGGNYGKNSLLTIEFLFSEVPGLEKYFNIDTQRTDGFRKFKGDKVKFARDIIPLIYSAHFEVFRPMFEFIKSKI
ncbi:ATP-dependent nuclease [Arenibacter echinorum]|uniref:AAA ATPase-like protein n=1 Tax=Arenibacter echinorum TaxID=440515 RepID=A0A327R6W5_9FLAO|nr:AAA family ATPase [Arenibacter echinorum]RAJ11712.1 AAA ATPase-like protein [Arenibacter echinorum]